MNEDMNGGSKKELLVLPMRSSCSMTGKDSLIQNFVCQIGFCARCPLWGETLMKEAELQQGSLHVTADLSHHVMRLNI